MVWVSGLGRRARRPAGEHEAAPAARQREDRMEVVPSRARRNFLLGAVATAAMSPLASRSIRRKAVQLLGLEQSSFTLAILPDTQYYSEKFPEIFKAQTLYIRERAAQDNIQLVIHEGDVVQTPKSAAEWARADVCLKVLEDADIPYTISPGNHDMAPGDGVPGSRSEKRDMIEWDATLPLARFRSMPTFGGSFDDTSQNTWHLVDAGFAKVLVLSLTFCVSDEVLEWANEVVRSHPDCHVQVNTHCYMFTDNTRLGAEDHGTPVEYPELGGGNDGDQIWHKLIKLHPNIYKVTSGHVTVGPDAQEKGCRGYRTDVGVHGNVVHQMLANYQTMDFGGKGWMLTETVRVIDDRLQVSLRTVSPWLKQRDLSPEVNIDFEIPLVPRQEKTTG